jgi:hypothetical membrane protein
VNYYFLALLILCAGYALAAGGAPERTGSAIYVVSAVVTYLILGFHSGHKWFQVEFGVFIVDVITFVVFVWLALRANRFWPIWVSALLGLGVLAHLARLAGPDVRWYAYAVVLTIWSYPILAIMALGTFNHQRRMRLRGSDRSWSKPFARSAPPSPPEAGPTA